MNGGSILYGGQTPSHTVVSRGWGAVVVRNDTGLVEAVYRAPNPRIASYAARSQYHGGIGLRTWEEYTVGLGLPFAALMLAVVLNLPAASLMIPAIAASFGIVLAMRALAGRASTARILASGKAVTKLVVSGNDDLISAAIDPVVGLDSDPKGAAQLVNELRDVWKAAEASSATEKIGVIHPGRRPAGARRHHLDGGSGRPAKAAALARPAPGGIGVDLRGHRGRPRGHKRAARPTHTRRGSLR